MNRDTEIEFIEKGIVQDVISRLNNDEISVEQKIVIIKIAGKRLQKCFNEFHGIEQF